MGLIDNLRDEKDSWKKRYEEHRSEKEEYDYKYEKQNALKIEAEIKKNCEKVGKFYPVSERV